MRPALVKWKYLIPAFIWSTLIGVSPAAHEAWLAYPDNGRVSVCPFSPAGPGDTMVVTGNGAAPFPPAITIGADGMPAVAWLNCDNDVLFSRYDGRDWSGPETVALSRGGHRGLPSLAFEGDRVIVAWAEGVPGCPEDIFFALKELGSWGKPCRAHNANGYPDILPRVFAREDGQFCIVWKSLCDGRYVERSMGNGEGLENSTDPPGSVIDTVLKMGFSPQAVLSWRDAELNSHSICLKEVISRRQAAGIADEAVARAGRSDTDIELIAFGDSITYGKGSSSGGPRTGYPVYLQAILDYNYPTQGFRVINAGNPGEKTSEGLNRIDDVLSSYSADYILIMEGTNDLFFNISFETIQENLKQMAFRAWSSGVMPILATIIPTDPDIRPEQYMRTRSFYLGRYIQILSDRYGVAYADQWQAFCSIPNFGAALINPDLGNHPNDNGYRFVMAPEWYETLSPLLELPFETVGPEINIDVDEPSVHRGAEETFSYTLNPSNDLVRNGVDCYAALLTPQNRLYYFNSNWQLTTGVSYVARKMFLNNFPTSGTLNRLHIGSSWPTGSYKFYLVAVRSLRDPANREFWMSNLAEISFEVIE